MYIFINPGGPLFDFVIFDNASLLIEDIYLKRHLSSNKITHFRDVGWLIQC
jgi:hypothetical protein